VRLVDVQVMMEELSEGEGMQVGEVVFSQKGKTRFVQDESKKDSYSTPA
jgi:hypothetical protein